MSLDVSETRTALDRLRIDGDSYFDRLLAHIELTDVGRYAPADTYWSRVGSDFQSRSYELQSSLLRAVKPIANSLRFSALASDADTQDLSFWTRTVRASLRLRRYEYSEIEVLHDEGQVLGVQRESQSEDIPLHPEKARLAFNENLVKIMDVVDIVELAPELPADEWRSNPQATASFELNTAFVMMAINPTNPDLEDTYRTIKRCFEEFNIAAVAAHEIEHQGVITEEIRRRIRTSQFLLADVSFERPNVYYEVGYAHAISRPVILYRKAGTKLHFDLSVHNCPEYANNTALEDLLRRRLESMTGRRAQ